LTVNYRSVLNAIDKFSNYNKTMDELQSIENQQGNGVLPCVTNRYLFWFEDEGKEGWTFEIEAKDSDEAYDKAYDTHGPQVEGMMYQLL
jgi:hypothetical protein